MTNAIRSVARRCLYIIYSGGRHLPSRDTPPNFRVASPHSVAGLVVWGVLRQPDLVFLALLARPCIIIYNSSSPEFCVFAAETAAYASVLDKGFVASKLVTL